MDSRRVPVWLVPAAILVALSLSASLVVFRLSGGAEIADDAAKLIRFAREPFVLWGNYREAGFSNTWGSYPPFLPLVYGILVRPWLSITGSDFWGIRLGILSWSVVALLVIHFVLKGEPALSRRSRFQALLVFAVLPSVLGAIAFIPQEEIYVSIYCVVLYMLAKSEKWGALPFVFALTFLAGKYYLFALAVPVSLAAPRPARSFVLWTGIVAVLLAAYIVYHGMLHRLTPVMSYVVDPRWSISVWGLVWNLREQVDLQLARVLPLPILAAAIVGFSLAARRRGLPLVFSMAGVLFVMFLGLSATGPGYLLWAVPLVLISASHMTHAGHRVATVALLFLWGAGEWGANLFRGVKLALDTERAGGKTAIASVAERFLGADFPYHACHMACIALVVLCGVFQLYILWRAGGQRSVTSRAAS